VIQSGDLAEDAGLAVWPVQTEQHPCGATELDLLDEEGLLHLGGRGADRMLRTTGTARSWPNVSELVSGAANDFHDLVQGCSLARDGRRHRDVEGPITRAWPPASRNAISHFHLGLPPPPARRGIGVLRTPLRDDSGSALEHLSV